jgi:hypothetical protein
VQSGPERSARSKPCGMAESSWGKLNLISDFLEDIIGDLCRMGWI